MNTGERLRKLREERGYSQQEVAKLIGVGRTTYLKYESGENKPVRKLDELSKLFNVPIDYILCNDTPPTNTPAAPTSPTDPHAAPVPVSPSTPPALSPDEQDILQKYRALPDGGKDTVKAVLNVQYNLTKPKSPDDKAM